MPKKSEKTTFFPALPYDVIGETTPRKTGKFRLVSKTHVAEALTMYLRSMSMINDDEEVTNFNKAPDALDVKVEKIS